jgi:hypothetical protein
MIYTTYSIRVSFKSVKRFISAILTLLFLRHSLSVRIQLNNLIHSLLQYPALFTLPDINWNYRTVAIFVIVNIQMWLFINHLRIYLCSVSVRSDRLCGLVVKSFWVQTQRSRVRFPRFQIFWEAAGLQRGPLSLVRTTEELLEEKVSAAVYKTEINDRGNPLRWPRDTLYPQKLALLRQQAVVARGPKPWSLVLVCTKFHFLGSNDSLSLARLNGSTRLLIRDG